MPTKADPFRRTNHAVVVDRLGRSRAVTGWRRWLTGCFVMGWGLLPLAAAPHLAITPTTQPPVLDGRLNDAAWATAAHGDTLRETYPRADAPATERTEFWVTYDRDNLYVAVRCHQSTGKGGVRAYTMRHDQDNGTDDMVQIMIDPYQHQTDGYYFGLTAAGGKIEGLIQNQSQSVLEWDGLWVGKVSRDAGGWSAEFAIPFKTLSFAPDRDTWGFDVARWIRRQDLRLRWANVARDTSTLYAPAFGEVRGLAGLQQGRGIELKPYISSAYHSESAATTVRPGLDVIWHVTPSLATTLTLNTDFSDAEVDDRQVNLGRFPLRYPEKRSFFLQDASYFSFSGLTPFFSRRIGLAADGSKIDLLGGVKLTGRAGPWTLGVLDVEVEEHGPIPEKNLFVARISRQVGDESTAGLIMTHGDPRGPGSASLVGADFSYVNSHAIADKPLTLKASVQGTSTDATDDTGYASVVSISYPNEPFEIYWQFTRIDQAYDPALGYIARTGINQAYFWNRYRWYPEKWHIRFIDTFLECDVVADRHGRRLDFGSWFPGTLIKSQQGDEYTVWWTEHRERLTQPFEILPGIVIAPGNHSWSGYHLGFESNPSRVVNLDLSIEPGTFYEGWRTDWIAGLGWRPSIHLEAAFDWGLRDIRLPTGSFQVRTTAARIVYSLSPDLQVSCLGQYDNVSETIGVNCRLRWTPTPGNEYYLVLNQGYDTAFNGLRPTDSQVAAKGVWTWRF